MSRFDEVLESSQQYAKKARLRLNPDKKTVKRVIEGLIANEKKHGALYCPCRVLIGNEEDKKNICPCAFHKIEIKRFGHCLCQLFFK
jgi:ferredoxin-thioredoxin reductase catalytic subunit